MLDIGQTIQDSYPCPILTSWSLSNIIRSTRNIVLWVNTQYKCLILVSWFLYWEYVFQTFFHLICFKKAFDFLKIASSTIIKNWFRKLFERQLLQNKSNRVRTIDVISLELVQYVLCKNDQTGGKHILNTNYLILKIHI